MKVFKNIRKNNYTSQILFSCDWHKKVHCIATLGRTTTFEFLFFQHPIPILLAFFSAKSANPTVFRIRILLAFFSSKSANSTVFRIPILLVTEIFSAKPTVFRRLCRLQIPKKYTLNVISGIITGFFHQTQHPLHRDFFGKLISKG